MKKLFFIMAVLLLIASCSFALDKACFEDTCFNVEVVDTPETRQKGLMHRENLALNEGMLFVFDTSGNYPFWMKNTLIPLDMIWMNEEKEIVFIAKNVQPCEEDPCPSVNPGVDALYVLEINGGLSDVHSLEVGMRAEFD